MCESCEKTTVRRNVKNSLIVKVIILWNMILYKICKNIPILSLTTYNQNDTIKENKNTIFIKSTKKERN